MRPADHLVDTAGLGPLERAEVCCRVLHELEETVKQFETDVPWTEQDEWPEATRAAAAALLAAAGRAVDTTSYQATGMVQRDDEVWDAFCLVAGHAYDASAWSSTRAQPLVSLSDSGTVLVVHVDEAERQRLELAIRPVPVVPLRRSRRARRRDRG